MSHFTSNNLFRVGQVLIRIDRCTERNTFIIGLSWIVAGMEVCGISASVSPD